MPIVLMAFILLVALLGSRFGTDSRPEVDDQQPWWPAAGGR
jgi:hypothetical protein